MVAQASSLKHRFPEPTSPATDRNSRLVLYTATGTYAARAIVLADGMLALRVYDAGQTFEVRLSDVLP